MRNWLRNLGIAFRLPLRTAHPRYRIPENLAGWFLVVEIDDAEAYAGALFRRCFRTAPPDSPRHYVARVDVSGKERTIGYIHYSRLENVYLGGGMCIDDRVFRRLSSEHRARLKAAGGVAEQMLRYTFADLGDAKAIFGYVGDKRAERVDLRAGFQHTEYKHLIVYWPNRVPEIEQRALIERIAKLGPF